MIKTITITVALGIFVFVLDLVRREKLTFRYAFGWLVVSLGAVFFAAFDRLLFKAAFSLGFELPSNFIFFTLLGVFVILSLLMTIFLCQQHKRNDIMAQRIGILEAELRDLKNKNS